MKRIVRLGTAVLLSLVMVLAFSPAMLQHVLAEDSTAAGNYDTGFPVIGDLTVSKANGETVQNGDQINISLKAEDYQGKINEIDLAIVFEPDNGLESKYDDTAFLRYHADYEDYNALVPGSTDDTINTYSGTYTVSGYTVPGTIHIASVAVVDDSNNQTNKYYFQRDERGNRTFTYSWHITPEIVVSGIQLKSATIIDTSANPRQEISDRRITENGRYAFQLAFDGDLTDVKEFKVYYKNPNDEHFLYRESSAGYYVDANSIEADISLGERRNVTEETVLTSSIESIYAIYSNGTAKSVDMNNVDTSFSETIAPSSTNKDNVKYKNFTLTKNKGEAGEAPVQNGDEVTVGDKLSFSLSLAPISGTLPAEAKVIVKFKFYIDSNGVSYDDGTTTSFANDVKSIGATYNAADNTYTGSLDIDDKMYPTVWTIEVFLNGDVINSSDNSDVSFAIRNGGTSVRPQVTNYFYVNAYYVDENGKASPSLGIDGRADGMTTLSGLALEKLTADQIASLNLPKDPKSPTGAAFTKWYVTDGQTTVPLDEFIFKAGNNYSQCCVYPGFEDNKKALFCDYWDQNADGSPKWFDSAEMVSSDMTDEEIISMCMAKLSASSAIRTFKVGRSPLQITASPVYKKALLHIFYRGENAAAHYYKDFTDIVRFVEPGSYTADDVKAWVDADTEAAKANMPDAGKFQGWTIQRGETYESIAAKLSAGGEYVIFLTTEVDAPANDTPYVPDDDYEPSTSSGGSDNAETNPNVNTATNPTDSEKAAVAANPDKLQLVNAEEGQDGGVKAAPAVVEEQVKAVSDKIAAISEAASKENAAPVDKTVTIDMAGANIVPVEVLKEARGKDVDVVFDMGDYTWTVNGKNVGSIDLKDINLAVDKKENAVPSTTVEALAEGRPSEQISLRHEGTFGFAATLTMKAPVDQAGKYGNLYWYDSAKRLIFQNSSLVASDGTMSLKFSHASDYVIIYGEEATPELVTVYRLLNAKTGEHLYTADEVEKTNCMNAGWTLEGTAFKTAKTSDTPVYRLFNPFVGMHFYTTGTDEMDALKKCGWLYEGVAFYSGGSVPVYRVYDKHSSNCNHLFTTGIEERDVLKARDWNDEGIGWYAYE